MSEAGRTIHDPMPSSSSPKPAPPDSTDHPQDVERADVDLDPVPSQDTAQPAKPPFQPLFTLLTNSTTNSTVHPRVHYLFSDDDNPLLANAASDPAQRALLIDLVPSSTTSKATEPTAQTSSSTLATGEAAAAKDTPPPQPTADETASGAGGWSISWASSLTPDFAITGSSLALQQSDGDADGTVMLRVDGVEREPVNLQAEGGGSLRSSAASGTAGREDVDGLVEDFRRRMGVLRKIVAQGERRRDVVGRGGGEGEEEGEEEREEAVQGRVPLHAEEADEPEKP